MSQKIDEVVGADTLTVDISEMSAIASNIEVPSEPPEDSGVGVEMDDGKSRKKRKRKMKNVDLLTTQIEPQEVSDSGVGVEDEDSAKNDTQQAPGPGNVVFPPTSWAGIPPGLFPMKLLQPGVTAQSAMGGAAADILTSSTAPKPGTGGKVPFPTAFPCYGPYGPMAFIPVPLFPNFMDKEGKGVNWPQGFPARFPLVTPAQKRKSKSGGSSNGDGGDAIQAQPKQSGEDAMNEDCASGGEDSEDKPIRTSVIMAGSQNKKQKQDKSSNDDDEIGEEEVTIPSGEGAFRKILNRDHSDADMDAPNSSSPASPASSENSTSTNHSGPHDVLLRVSEAHLALLADEDGDTPLHIAIIHEKLELVKHMVKTITGVYMNLDIANHMRQTPLHLAIITQQPMMVEVLVKHGASVNFPDRKGNTSLHLAAQRRDVRCLEQLSKATSPLPDYNAKNFCGLSPVHIATQEASLDVLRFLFAKEANKNAVDSTSGRAALHYAVEQENVRLVNFLIQEGCDTNAATYSGNTPLHIAAGRKMKDIVALLMAYGANPSIVNSEGDIPHDLPPAALYTKAKRV